MEHIAQFAQCMLLSCVSTNFPATYICLPFLGKCHLDKIVKHSHVLQRIEMNDFIMKENLDLPSAWLYFSPL